MLRLETLRQVWMFGTVVGLLFGIIHSCPIAMLDGWKQKPVEERAMLADVVAVGTAIQVHIVEHENKKITVVDFKLLDVLKGRNFTDRINAYSDNSLFRFFGYGSPAVCLSHVTQDETYLLFAMFEPKTMGLVARYDSAFGATALPTKENCDRIQASLGWGPWSDWSSCSVSCGGGWQNRARICHSANKCYTFKEQKRRCNKYDCEGVSNLLSYFKPRIQRSISPPHHRNALRITDSANLFVRTSNIFWNLFVQDFTLFASSQYVNYTSGYLLSFYDSNNKFQIGIKISNTSVALEYAARKDSIESIAFDVEVIDRKWHQFAFSVRNGTVSFYLDCDLVGKKVLEHDRIKKVDHYGDVYLGGKALDGTKVEFYIEELSLTYDAEAGEEQCVAFNGPYENSYEFSGSGASGDNTDEKENPVVFEYEWSSWTRCSHTCGEQGVKKRIKICSNTSINYPYSQCHNILQDIETEPCNTGIQCPAHCQQYCMNGGTCVAKNKCLCRPGYYGISCEKVISCKRKCVNGGRCISHLGSCKCPKGFGGKYCEKASCYIPCPNGGVCVRPGICKCRQGYLPPFCKPSCHPSCMNKGICVMPDKCQCRTGFIGRFCQRAVCTKPCLNGGLCYNRNKCNCKSGWTGETCNIAICHPKCLNGGYCRSPNLCTCPNQTSGTYCQKVVCNPRCLNGGKCVQGNRCVCSARYMGYRCKTPLCRPNCRNGGKCVAPNQCMCPSGFFGDFCERRSCIYKTRVVPQKRSHLVPITTKYQKRCSHHSVWRPCTEERTEYRMVHITTYRIIYYCG